MLQATGTAGYRKLTNTGDGPYVDYYRIGWNLTGLGGTSPDWVEPHGIGWIATGSGGFLSDQAYISQSGDTTS